jgi:co-chaperonin GroES (HSP10)
MPVELVDGGAIQEYHSATSLEGGLRPLQDYLIVEPLDPEFSKVLQIVYKIKPLRGIVRAAGPGHYPRRYDHPEKHKRTKMWRSERFQPTEVKVGDTIQLGGLNYGGYAFETFTWNGVVHLICREADVVGIESAGELEPGRASQCA